MSGRNTPVIEVSEKDCQEYTNRQLGSRVLAALAHTPARKETGSYHTIIIVSDKTQTEITSEELLEIKYDTIIQQQVTINDEWQEKVGRIVRKNMKNTDEFILARS